MILQSDNGREFVNDIIDELKALWPECVIVHGRARHPQSNGGVERGNQDVENMLGAWMRENNSSNWSLAIHVVAMQKNDRVHSTYSETPYKLQYGQDRRVGLSSTLIPKHLLETLKTEEDLQAVLGQTQVLSPHQATVGVITGAALGEEASANSANSLLDVSIRLIYCTLIFYSSVTVVLLLNYCYI